MWFVLVAFKGDDQRSRKEFLRVRKTTLRALRLLCLGFHHRENVLSFVEIPGFCPASCPYCSV
ncbi:hypothetical protein CRG98_005721 [Punica granatum]|uniref:Uncharacterized protein n=1 Tax=Punica granatum TaxID=22663 RepID=A0A2I0KZG1_PUNGR|nr:hypothetical protein CRG98_005721 [Punica granatum]